MVIVLISHIQKTKRGRFESRWSCFWDCAIITIWYCIPLKVKGNCFISFFLNISNHKKYILYPDLLHTCIKINLCKKFCETTLTYNIIWFVFIIFCFINMLVAAYPSDDLEGVWRKKRIVPYFQCAFPLPHATLSVLSCKTSWSWRRVNWLWKWGVLLHPLQPAEVVILEGLRT